MSKIEWTEQTWNPVTGCTKISPGCKNCYAQTMHGRLNAMGANGYEKPFTTINLQPNRLSDPKKRKKPTTYFVNSMSDLFHEDVPADYVWQILDIIKSTPQHTYQVLTKRHRRLWDFCFTAKAYQIELPKNLWLGVSVEDQKHGKERIEYLRDAPGIALRFLSIEPLLEDLGELDLTDTPYCLRRIDWVIVGGESGPKARPMKADWVRNIRDQCQKKYIPFFFKQWGTYGEDGQKRNKKANGRKLDGKEYNEMPRAVDKQV